MTVKRDYERFKKMSNDGGRPVMPEGYSADLEIVPIRVLIRRRLEKDKIDAALHRL